MSEPTGLREVAIEIWMGSHGMTAACGILKCSIIQSGKRPEYVNASAVILAAGAGTRMKSKKPKVAHEMLGKPLVRWVVDAAQKAGIEQLIAVVGHEREQVIPLVEEDAAIVVQEQLNGTADAVMSCRETLGDFKGSLLVLSGDCPLITSETLATLIAVREENHAAVVVLTMTPDDPFGYGRIVRDEKGLIERIVEQKDCVGKEALITECNSGFYCFDARVLFEALDQVNSENAQGEYYLTDVIEIARKAGHPVLAVETQDTECLGINAREQLALATTYAQRQINARLMDQGVTMTDPSLVWVGPDVRIERDVEILPLTFLYGNTFVGEDSVIGPNSRLTDTVVGRACLLDETIAVQARIDDEVTCGPRAYLRPQTHLCHHAKAGTHVEIKNSVVGEGSKVPHLSYVGDTTIGENSNIGAGTITCNYDGENKHKTEIGNDVFVGSDTMLVAPVSLGDGSLIGAGSVITKDVSADALALARGRQREVSNWKERKTKRTIAIKDRD